MKSTKHIATFAAVAALAVAGVTATAVARDDGGRLKSDTLIGVPLTLKGDPGIIRDVPGAGRAWAIGESEISVKSSGKIEVEFDNLVFAEGPNVGKNTIPEMAVVVSCLDVSNHTVNKTSAPFAVTVFSATDPSGDPGGDADAKTSVVGLPSPCFAPIVFVTPSNGAAWFAVDGL